MGRESGIYSTLWKEATSLSRRATASTGLARSYDSALTKQDIMNAGDL